MVEKKYEVHLGSVSSSPFSCSLFYQAEAEKYKKAKADLDELVISMEGI
jgi:hypothetical protein